MCRWFNSASGHHLDEDFEDMIEVSEVFQDFSGHLDTFMMPNVVAEAAVVDGEDAGDHVGGVRRRRGERIWGIWRIWRMGRERGRKWGTEELKN